MLALKTLAMAGLLALSLPSLATAQTTWHVDDDAVPGGDGLTWASAFDSLDAALQCCAPFDQVWLAEGLYLPSTRSDPVDPRSATFLLEPARSLYGGFLGFELELEERAGSFDRTVLSGELGSAQVVSDNAYHVVRAHHAAGSPPGPVVLDGLTIRAGNATGGSILERAGGGIHASNVGVVLRNVTLRDNRAERGGGLFVQPAMARLAWCRFVDNVATGAGGALFGQATSIFAHGTVFAGNRAEGRGGAVFLESMAGVLSAAFESCVFHDNEAAFGGALCLPGGPFTSGKAWLGNCTLAFNRASREGGALRAEGDAVQEARCLLANSIVWFNEAPHDPNVSGGRIAAVHCSIEGKASSAGGQFPLAPRFVDPLSRDLRLAAGSPGIDAGDRKRVAPDVLDLDGDGDWSEPTPFDADMRSRVLMHHCAGHLPSGEISLPRIDLGAYEISSTG